MFLHLGADRMVKLHDLIVIINNENPAKADNTIEYLKMTRDQRVVEKIGKDDYKSIVVTTDKVYYSPISSQTLKKRASYVTNLAE